MYTAPKVDKQFTRVTDAARLGKLRARCQILPAPLLLRIAGLLAIARNQTGLERSVTVTSKVTQLLLGLSFASKVGTNSEDLQQRPVRCTCRAVVRTCCSLRVSALGFDGGIACSRACLVSFASLSRGDC